MWILGRLKAAREKVDVIDKMKVACGHHCDRQSVVLYIYSTFFLVNSLSKKLLGISFKLVSKYMWFTFCMPRRAVPYQINSSITWLTILLQYNVISFGRLMRLKSVKNSLLQ